MLTDTGVPVPEARTLSTKVALAWDALYRIPYTARLSEAVAPFARPGEGLARRNLRDDR